jgi:hypothetical protein
MVHRASFPASISSSSRKRTFLIQQGDGGHPRGFSQCDGPWRAVQPGPTHEISGISVRGAVSEEAVQEQPRATHHRLAIWPPPLPLR